MYYGRGFHNKDVCSCMKFVQCQHVLFLCSLVLFMCKETNMLSFFSLSLFLFIEI